MSHIAPESKVGIYTKDAVDGDLTKRLLEALEERRAQLRDFKELFEQVNIVKIAEEVQNMNTAAAFVKWTFDKTIKEVEHIIEDEKKTKHDSISKKIEQLIESKSDFKSFLAT